MPPSRSRELEESLSNIGLYEMINYTLRISLFHLLLLRIAQQFSLFLFSTFPPFNSDLSLAFVLKKVPMLKIFFIPFVWRVRWQTPEIICITLRVCNECEELFDNLYFWVLSSSSASSMSLTKRGNDKKIVILMDSSTDDNFYNRFTSF